MIKVLYKTLNERITHFEISGHAGAADIGQDLVCAGASTVAVGLINAIDLLTQEKGCRVSMKRNRIKVEVIDCDDQQLQTILRVGRIQLETLQEQYAENIKIETMEV